MFRNGENQYGSGVYSFKIDAQMQCNSNPAPRQDFCRKGQSASKLYLAMQKNLEQPKLF